MPSPPFRISPHLTPLPFATRQVAGKFNQPLNLDTSSVTTMYHMFYEASAFNQPLSLDTSSVTDMEYMFGVRVPSATLQLDASLNCFAPPPPSRAHPPQRIRPFDLADHPISV